MPINIVSLLVIAKDSICWIIDRLDKLGLSENIVSRITKKLEDMQLKIKEIEPYLKRDSDTKEIQDILTHLEKAKKLCVDIKGQHTIVKFALAASDLIKLHNIEAEVKDGYSKLLLFIASKTFTFSCDTADFQNKKT